MEEVTTPCLEYRGYRNANGYGRVPFGSERRDALGRKRGRRMVLLHRWVVEQVEGPLGPGEIVMHRCDNPPCFRYDHLRRATQAANVVDAERKGRGRRPHGREHPLAKLDEDSVRVIRASSDPARALASRFGVSRTLIRHVRSGRGWPHVR